MTKPNSNTYDFPPSLAMLLGAAAGLTAGLFIAGRGGQKLRGEISGAMEDYWQAGSAHLNELREQGSALASQGIRKLKGMKAAATAKADAAICGGEQHAHEVIDQAAAAVDSAAASSHQTVSRAADSLRTGTCG